MGGGRWRVRAVALSPIIQLNKKRALREPRQRGHTQLRGAAMVASQDARRRTAPLKSSFTAAAASFRLPSVLVAISEP